MTAQDNATLYTLGDRGQTIEGSINDIRGREVRDETGAGVGKVADLLVDDQENKVRFLLVEHGGFLGFGEKKSLIPVDAITRITDDHVDIGQSRDKVAAAPDYDPKLVEIRSFYDDVYSHYGYIPYWGPGYVYAGYPFLGSPAAAHERIR